MHRANNNKQKDVRWGVRLAYLYVFVAIILGCALGCALRAAQGCAPKGLRGGVRQPAPS